MGRVVGVMNLSDKTDGSNFSKDEIAIVELFRQLVVLLSAISACLKKPSDRPKPTV